MPPVLVHPPPDVLLADSVTDLGPDADGRVVVCGSHAGTFTGLVAAGLGVGGIVLNDAGLGIDGAGIAGLGVLADAGVPAAAVASAESRIGRATDTARGTVRHVNAVAYDLGCRPGDPVERAVGSMVRAGLGVPADRRPPRPPENRTRTGSGTPAVWVLDSASLVRAEDARTVVVTGSHGGLPGNRPERALRADVRLAVFNDAGGGLDGAGWSRLPALQRRDVAAVTVDEWSARIGDGASTYAHGLVVRANDRASALGALAGMPIPELVELATRPRKDRR